jgi:hypothetical protein
MIGNLQNQLSTRLFVISSFNKQIPQDLPIFYGYAQSDRSLIFGRRGYRDWACEFKRGKEVFHSGRYLLVDYTLEGDLVVECDPSGMECVYLYRNEKDFALSNSFLALGYHLIRMGVALNPCKNALYSMFLQHSMGKTLISNSTPIKGISVVSRGYRLKVSRNWRLSVDEIPGLKGLFVESGSSNDLFGYLERSKSLFQALSRLPRARRPVVDLSGGVDSRAVLAILIGSGLAEKFTYYSSAKNSEEIEIAREICNRYSIKMTNKSQFGNRVDDSLTYQSICAGNAGIYNRMTAFPRCQSDGYRMRVSGAGGGMFGGVANPFKRALHPTDKELIRLLPEPEMVRPVSKAFSEARKLSPYDGNNLRAVKHFCETRCRHHNGREFYEGLNRLPVSPLIHRQLEHAAGKLPERFLGWKYLQFEMIFMGGGMELLSIPFHDDALRRPSTDKLRSLGALAEQMDYTEVNASQLDVYNPELSVDEGEVVTAAQESRVKQSSDVMRRIEGTVSVNYDVIARSGLFGPATLKELDMLLDGGGSVRRKDLMRWHSIALVCDMVMSPK